MSHDCPECGTPDCDCEWFNGFDAGWEGRPPDSPDELYLEGFCAGILDLEESDAEDAEERAACDGCSCRSCKPSGDGEEQPCDDEEHPDSEYEPEHRGE